MVQVGDLVEVVHRYTQAGQIVNNVYGFECLDATEPFANLAVDLQTTTNGLKKVMTNMKVETVTLDITVRDVWPGTASSYVLSSGAMPAGTITSGSAGEYLPPQAAMVCKLSTALAGRSYRGRVYLCGIGEASQSAGIWIPAVVAGFQNDMTAFLARYNYAGGVYGKYGLVVISRQHNGAVRPNPVGTPVTQISVRNTVFNQRRRTVGVGV